MTATTSPRFVQIHSLTSYPASLLNRDDAGFAKRVPFGDVSRVRISSQCLKRHWRTFEGEHALSELGQPESIRSRLTFERELIQPLVATQEHDEKLVRAVVEALGAKVLGESAKAKKEKEEGTEKKPKKGKKDGPDEATEPVSASYQTNQVTVIGRPEINYLRDLARQLCNLAQGAEKPEKVVDDYFKKEGKKLKDVFDNMRMSAGLEAALFGRMVTSDILSRGDAALHVAHAFTVHAEQSETDYFSAIDDLEKQDGKLGSGHINSTELTSGLFYSYVVIDVPLLVSNLTGCDAKKWQEADRKLAGDVIERIIKLIATVSPGAKLGSTAPHSYAHMVLVETGNAQPSTLANAFLAPIRTSHSKPDVIANTYDALAGFVEELDEMYGKRNARKLAAIKQTASLGQVAERAPLADVASWAASQVRGDRG